MTTESSSKASDNVNHLLETLAEALLAGIEAASDVISESEETEESNFPYVVSFSDAILERPVAGGEIIGTVSEVDGDPANGVSFSYCFHRLDGSVDTDSWCNTVNFDPSNPKPFWVGVPSSLSGGAYELAFYDSEGRKALSQYIMVASVVR